MISLFTIYSDIYDTDGDKIYCTTAVTHLAHIKWIERAGEKLLFLLFLLVLWKQGMVILNQSLTNSQPKNCQIRRFQMTFLLEANKSWWLNGTRSHQCSDLSAEMRHQAEDNISMLSKPPPPPPPRFQSLGHFALITADCSFLGS